MRSGLITLLIALNAAGASAESTLPEIEWVSIKRDSEIARFVRRQLSEFPEADSELEALRQARQTGRIAQDALNNRGYFAAKVEAAVQAGPPPRPALRIAPGRQFRLSDITVSFAEERPAAAVIDAVRAAIPLTRGDIALPERVIASEGEILSALRQAGYGDVQMAGRDVRGDRSAATLAVNYRVIAGPQIAFANVRFPDDIRTRSDYLDRFVPFTRGDRYSPDALDTLNERLAGTRQFTLARAQLGDTGTGITPENMQLRDVIVELRERPRHQLGLGGSFATDRGVGFNAELTRRNLTGRGDNLVLGLTAAQLSRSLDVTWRRPNQFGFGRGLAYNSVIIQEETDAFDRRAVSLGARFESTRNARLTYSLGLQGELIRETARLDARSDLAEDRTVQLFTFSGAMKLDQADSVLNPRQGWRLDLSAEPNIAVGDTQAQFVRTIAQLRGYLPLDGEKKRVIAGRMKFATSLGAEIGDLPSEKRFFAGGGGSVRGFGFQDIGPRTPDGTPLGGRSLSEASVELRWRIREAIEIVGFVDAGAVSDRQQFEFSDARFGTGFGARYLTAAGPIRVDIGFPIDRNRFDDPFQIYLSIGQAF